MPLDASQFIQEFNELVEADDIKSQLRQEKNKLELMREVENKIKTDLLVHQPSKAPEKEQQKSKLKKILSHSAYYFLLVFGLFQSGIGSYLFGMNLFLLIPGIPNLLLIAASAVYTLLDCILFYAFQISLLRQGLGIPFTKSQQHELIETYKEQLKTAMALNEYINTLPVLSIDNQLYKEYLRCTEAINEDLRKKNLEMNAYKESIPKAVLKYAVLTFGAISTVAGSYFIANTYMAIAASSLIGTPLGWIIIGLTIMTGLGFYCFMGAKGAARLANPDYEAFHKLKEEFKEFEKKCDAHLERTSALKYRYEKKTTMDAETQTEPFHQNGLTFFEHTEAQEPSSAGCTPHTSTERPLPLVSTHAV